MNLFHFNPPNRQIQLGKGFYEVGPLSIKILVLIYEKFGSFEKFEQILQIAKKTTYNPDFAEVATWLTYTLLIDKSRFDEYEKFEKAFLNQSENTYLKNINTIFLTISDSQPIIENRSKEPAKKNNTDELFSKSFVSIAREIPGYTIDKFYDLTFRQIHQIQIDLISLRNKDYEFQANIHGVKLNKPPDNRPNAKINFSKDEDEQITSFAKQRMEQLKNERAKFKS